MKVYPMGYSITFVEYVMVYPHHFHLPWHILSPNSQIYFAVEKLSRVLKFLRVLSVQSSFDYQTIGFSIGFSLIGSNLGSSSDTFTLPVLNPCIHPESQRKFIF